MNLQERPTSYGHCIHGLKSWLAGTAVSWGVYDTLPKFHRHLGNNEVPPFFGIERSSKRNGTTSGHPGLGFRVWSKTSCPAGQDCS